ILTQMYHDLFGKDVQETPTVSYTWAADQFGHFGLGFQITFLLGWISKILGYSDNTTLALLAVANIAIWVVKEGFDFAREQRKAKQARSVFRFNGLEILWNVITALFFIATGAAVAGVAVFGSWPPIVTFVALLVPATFIAIWWLRRK